MYYGVIGGMDQIDVLGGEPYLRKIAVCELTGDGLVPPHGVLPADTPESQSDGQRQGRDDGNGFGRAR
ncbi:hypothetical protein GCM10010358_24640 [Streptomyces minutiscleroticus]|uniref:Uncharacterized protein n=1 Tax=Streptomyces minutiscleroticus TaxID=68238 RepID=A0A918KMU2_9ACTN|nr:hypothetical protein GCM10010358_24640 [Streptomyces minutiscleroticus]